MDFRAYLKVLRRNLLLIVMCTTAVAALASFATYKTTPLYSSSARVFVSSAQSDTTEAYAGGLLSKQRVASYAVLVDSKILAQQVSDELGLKIDVGELSEMVTAAVVGDTVVLELEVIATDPTRAQLIAQTYAEKLVETTRKLETPAGTRAPPLSATIIDPASFSGDAVAPKPLRNLVLGLLFGLVLGVALSLLREVLDTTIKTPDDLAPTDGVPLMVSIALEPSGTKGRLLTELAVQSPRAEAFRVLRTNIQFVHVDRPHKQFVVASAVQEEGKTTTAVDLAISLASAGIKTLLIDGDLRRSSIAGLLGLDGTVGVTTVLLGKVTVEEAIQRHTLTDLDVLTSGVAPPNASELLQSNAMSNLMSTIRDMYEVVIIDSPPLIPVTDAALLAAQADGALLVVRYGKTTKDQLATALERLRQVDAATIGVVMNMVPTSKSMSGYSYGSYDGTRPLDGVGKRPRRR